MAVPVPERATATAELVALLVICKLPVALPAAAGVKVTVTAAVFPVAKVSGNAGLVCVKPVPVAAILLTVTDAPEELLSVRVLGELEPTTTLPKAKADELTVSVPCVGGGGAEAVPVPESATVALALVALLEICRLPFTAPAACGENVTVRIAVCPAGRTNGKVTALRLNPVPVMVRPLMLTATLELLLKVMFCPALEPVTTLPKASVCGLTVSVPCWGGGGVVVVEENSYAPMS